MIRILLADDHTVLREGLAAILCSSGDCQVVGQAEDGINAIEKALVLRPDVAVVDISMPRLNGLEVVRRLTADLPHTRTLVLTMHEDEEYVLKMIQAGAAGYLVKHTATTELLKAVRTLADGGVYFGSYAAKVLADQLHNPQHNFEDPYGNLTAREREVMHLVVEGWTTKEIARRLDVTIKTAENHRCRVLEKLEVRNSAELVRYAMRKRLVE
ncbi:MAG: response regulator transcription factor [Rudaea sp.]